MEGRAFPVVGGPFDGDEWVSRGKSPLPYILFPVDVDPPLPPVNLGPPAGQMPEPRRLLVARYLLYVSYERGIEYHYDCQFWH